MDLSPCPNSGGAFRTYDLALKVSGIRSSKAVKPTIICRYCNPFATRGERNLPHIYLKDYTNRSKQCIIIEKLNIGTSFYIGIKELSMKFQSMQLNSQQQKATEYDGGHVLVLAGAGTGKTRTIIARTAHLIRNSVSPKRILLLTFTRRAAGEMTSPTALPLLLGLGAVVRRR